MKGTVINKFQKFWKKLNVREKRTLYDLLAMIRGPPSMHNRDEFKDQLTSRIRWILFGEDLRYAFTNDQPISREMFDALREWSSSTGVVKFRDTPLPDGAAHYFGHALNALRRLEELGYEFEEVVKCGK